MKTTVRERHLFELLRGLYPDQVIEMQELFPEKSLCRQLELYFGWDFLNQLPLIDEISKLKFAIQDLKGKK